MNKRNKFKVRPLLSSAPKKAKPKKNYHYFNQMENHIKRFKIGSIYISKIEFIWEKRGKPYIY